MFGGEYVHVHLGILCLRTSVWVWVCVHMCADDDDQHAYDGLMKNNDSNMSSCDWQNVSPPETAHARGNTRGRMQCLRAFLTRKPGAEGGWGTERGNGGQK